MNLDNIVVTLKNVSKYYRIYESPKHRLKELIFNRQYHKKFWALKDIFLDIKKGETLGIIGENGAGKSTLLKIIAKTIRPSSGEVKVCGLVSPILELGMGFHPELTGRENIFFSATLLGLSKKDIEKKLDEIIEFAELEGFIDQPVKTYSSGMYIRLAFSIATSVDPDILVIDEALSVGDMYFQKKSLNRILEFKKRGITIIFCSHNPYHITHVCDRAIWMDRGKIIADGSSLLVVDEYESFVRKKQKKHDTEQIQQNSSLISLELSLNKILFTCGDRLIARFSIENPKKLKFHLSFAIAREDDVLCSSFSTYHDKIVPFDFDKGVVELIIDGLPFLSGNYKIAGAIMDDSATITYNARWLNFKVRKTDDLPGIFSIPHTWQLKK